MSQTQVQQSQDGGAAHVTTIQLHDDVIRMLNSLKKEMKVKSYEEVIRKLLASYKGFKKSYFGAFPGLSEFKRDEEDWE